MIHDFEDFSARELYVSKLIRKPYLEPVILMISGLESSMGSFSILTTASKIYQKHVYPSLFECISACGVHEIICFGLTS